MPSVMNPTVIVLWEHELRVAARSLKPFAGGGNPTPEDAEKMLRACFAAIYSAELADDDSCAVTVMSCRETVMVSKTEVKKA